MTTKMMKKGLGALVSGGLLAALAHASPLRSPSQNADMLTLGDEGPSVLDELSPVGLEVASGAPASAPPDGGRSLLSSKSLDLNEDEGVKALASEFPVGMRDLNLTLHQVDDDGLKAWASVLPNNLQKLALHIVKAELRHPMMEMQSYSMPDSMLDHISMQVSDSKVGDAGLEALAGALTESLLELNLDFAACGEIGDAGLEALANALPKSLKNFTLELALTNISDGGLKALAGAMPEALQNLHFNLAGTNVSDDGLKALAATLPQSLQSVRLDLYSSSFNAVSLISDDGLKALAAALSENLQSLDLDLFSTKVGDDGLKALTDALPEGLQSLHLNLFGTKVSDDGLQALAGALPESLRSFALDLGGTKVSDGGLEALAHALPESLQQLRLELYGIMVGDKGLEALAGALSSLSLQSFRFESYNMSAGTLEALAGALPESLQSLHLEFDDPIVGGEGLEVFLSSFPQSLESLRLDMLGPKVNDKTMEVLAGAVPESLRELRLGIQQTLVGDDGIKALAGALPKSMRSLSLDLRADYAVGEVGLKALFGGLPKDLQNFDLVLQMLPVSDDALEAALAGGLPKSLQSLRLDLFSATKVGDDALEALANALTGNLQSLDLNLMGTDVGDRGLLAICALDGLHQKGSSTLINALAIFISPLAATQCKEQLIASGATLSLQYDSTQAPWPKQVDDMIHGRDLRYEISFNCKRQEWIMNRDELGHTAYQRASALQGSKSNLTKCLAKAGGNPALSEQVRFTFGRPQTWKIIAASMLFASFFALFRVVWVQRLARSRSSNPGTRSEALVAPSVISLQRATSTVTASLPFRILEVSAQLILFFGPVSLALHQYVSMIVFLVAFVLAACVEHGLMQVVEEPVFVFANRTRLGFAFACLRAAVLAHIAAEFAWNTSRSCHQEESYDIKLNRAFASQCRSEFNATTLFGLFHLAGEDWAQASNPYLATIIDNDTWQKELITLPIVNVPLLEVSLKAIMDTYLYSFIALGEIWPLVVMLWFAWQHAAAPRTTDAVHDEEEVKASLQASDKPTVSDSTFATEINTMSLIFKHKEVPMLFVDMLLDANTVFNMLWTEHYKFAFVLLLVWFTSLFEELMIGDVLHLRDELEHIKTKGGLSTYARRILAREASFDASVSLALTAYAFPFVFSSASAMILGLFSMLSSCVTIGKHVHRALDEDNDILAKDEIKE